MSNELSAEEVQKQYVAAMGSELGNVFFKLRNECIKLHWKWEEYVALFGTKPQRVELLNKSADSFFWVVQDTFWRTFCSASHGQLIHRIRGKGKRI